MFPDVHPHPAIGNAKHPVDPAAATCTCTCTCTCCIRLMRGVVPAAALVGHPPKAMLNCILPEIYQDIKTKWTSPLSEEVRRVASRTDLCNMVWE